MKGSLGVHAGHNRRGWSTSAGEASATAAGLLGAGEIAGAATISGDEVVFVSRLIESGLARSGGASTAKGWTHPGVKPPVSQSGAYRRGRCCVTAVLFF